MCEEYCGDSELLWRSVGLSHVVMGGETIVVMAGETIVVMGGETMKQEEPKSFSFPITDTNIIKELDSLTQEQVKELNRILEEGLKELREKQ